MGAFQPCGSMTTFVCILFRSPAVVPGWRPRGHGPRRGGAATSGWSMLPDAPMPNGAGDPATGPTLLLGFGVRPLAVGAVQPPQQIAHRARLPAALVAHQPGARRLDRPTARPQRLPRIGLLEPRSRPHVGVVRRHRHEQARLPAARS